MRTHTRPHVVSRVQAMDVPHHFQSTCQMNDMICININTVTSLIIGIINPLGLFFSIKNNGLIVEIDYHTHTRTLPCQLSKRLTDYLFYLNFTTNIIAKATILLNFKCAYNFQVVRQTQTHSACTNYVTTPTSNNQHDLKMRW